MTNKNVVIKNRPFVQKSQLTGKWWLVTRWRNLGGEMREAVEKYDFDDAVNALIQDARASDTQQLVEDRK